MSDQINPCSKCGEVPELEERGGVEDGDDDCYVIRCCECWEGDDSGPYYAWCYSEDGCTGEWNEKNPVKG